MYYSKNSSPRISIPRNYSGNTFRQDSEEEKPYINEPCAQDNKKTEPTISQICEEKVQSPSLFSAVSGVSSEDLLLLGLILVILRDNPNDDLIMLFLLLLLVK